MAGRVRIIMSTEPTLYTDIYTSSYHGPYPLRQEESSVQSVHSIIDLHITLLLEQQRTSVQTIVCPEDREAGLPVSIHEGPEKGREFEGSTPLIRAINTGHDIKTR